VAVTPANPMVSLTAKADRRAVGRADALTVNRSCGQPVLVTFDAGLCRRAARAPTRVSSPRMDTGHTGHKDRTVRSADAPPLARAQST